jgi:hypothetical protein
MIERISKLPKWAQRYIQSLEDRIAYAEKTIPWTEPGMQWFTLFRPGPQIKDRAPMKLFTCSSDGTHCVCTLGPQDWIFIGRGKNNM